MFLLPESSLLRSASLSPPTRTSRPEVPEKSRFRSASENRAVSRSFRLTCKPGFYSKSKGIQQLMAIHICNFFLPGAHRLRQSCRVGCCPVQYGRPAGRPPPPGLYRLLGSSGTYGAASGERGRIPYLLQFQDTRVSASSIAPMTGNFFLQKRENN
jgi:hypothetical protein